MSDDTSGHNNNDDDGSYINSNGDKDIDPFRHEFNFSCCQKFQVRQKLFNKMIPCLWRISIEIEKNKKRWRYLCS